MLPIEILLVYRSQLYKLRPMNLYKPLANLVSIRHSPLMEFLIIGLIINSWRKHTKMKTSPNPSMISKKKYMSTSQISLIFGYKPLLSPKNMQHPNNSISTKK